MPFAIAYQIECYRQLQRQGKPAPCAMVGRYHSTRTGRPVRLMVLIEPATLGLCDPWPEDAGPSGGTA